MPQKASDLTCWAGNAHSGSASRPVRRPQSWPCSLNSRWPRSVALLDGECGERVVLGVEAHHAGEIDGAEDVDVVDEEGLVFGAAVFEKEPCGFFEAAAGVEQDVFAGDFNAHAEVLVGLKVVDDHVGEMMDIENHFD